MAVPEGTKVADTRDTTVLLLNANDAKTITVAIGPILELQYSGLSEEELLRQQSTNFISNYLWFVQVRS
ncbi:MAG TPA: hypothetical protein VIW67_01665 [Terriglobales bacterium]